MYVRDVAKYFYVFSGLSWFLKKRSELFTNTLNMNFQRVLMVTSVSFKSNLQIYRLIALKLHLNTPAAFFTMKNTLNQTHSQSNFNQNI